MQASDKDHDKLHASRSEELEKQVLKMKTEMRQKEEENVELLQQVQQIEDKWSLCEEKMKSMEELYQKQIESLKVRLTNLVTKGKTHSNIMIPLIILNFYALK